ncbi:MAG TPA: hypothetical protein VMW76_02805 [Bacteroidales bacterium]|nr:hypothetical protein [Bacteroidales bacterium]
MAKLLYISILLLLFTLQGLTAQEEEIIIDPKSNGVPCRFIFENPKGSVEITGYDGGMIIVQARPRFSRIGNSGTTEGLTRIPVHQMNLSASVKEGEVVLTCESDNRTIDFTILVPRDFSLKVGSKDYGEIKIVRIDGEIEANNPGGNISVENIRGPVVLTSVAGNVMARFASIDNDRPSMMTSFDGNIDVSVPEEVCLTFNLKSQKGEVLTDLDIKMAKREPRIGSQGEARIYQQDDWSTGHLNRGGTEFIISTYYGNIVIKGNGL